ncbi:glycoside hydrolase family 2 [Puteibacter caeruleilacunae]|nr:glycoside hydrolase family 2 [Puteibacter caeruleilacunae]
MKKIIALVALVFVCHYVQAQFSYKKEKLNEIRWTPNPTVVNGLKDHSLNLNGSWLFSVAPESDFYKRGVSADWNKIDVPGEWVMQGFDVEKGKAAGYYRTFILPKEWKDYRIKLKCEAVYSDCKIWVNGRNVGGHIGGFTPFEIDVTNEVTSGENSLALAIKSESLADSLSSGSQYAVHPLGGITRPIYLIAVPEMNIASFHVATSFDESFEDAELNADLVISNESRKNGAFKVEFVLKDAEGEVVDFEGDGKLISEVTQNSTIKLNTKLKVKQPKKWDPEHPHLYYLHCKVTQGGKETQQLVRRFGFRQIEVRGNQVFVNNKVVKLKGVCRHEVHPSRGRSLVGDIWYEDVKLFKEGNVNYIRTSHYPPNQKLLEACDELGMFVEVEGPFCWAHNTPLTEEDYFDGIIRPIAEMVEYNRSHPSILHWSVANESTKFNEWFKAAADLMKEMDSSRPRIFSQWGPNSDDGYLELANHHYPGPGGAAQYKESKRPITFDEYCHLNAYNRFELMTDPGLRDIWGDGLLTMWERMYKTPAVLGGALWAGIGDTFFLPSGKAVGYGTWGPIDGWRRKKPEFWHMKKVYSPVKIKLLPGNKDESVRLNIENRYFFSNLSECTIKWSNEKQNGILHVDLEPGKSTELEVPLRRLEMNKLSVEVYKGSEVPVDEYLFEMLQPAVNIVATGEETFKWSDNRNGVVAQSRKIKVELSDSKLKIYDAENKLLLNGLPELMMIPLNGEGAGVQMTKETPDFEMYSPVATNRSIESVNITKSTSQMIIDVIDSYTEAFGKMSIVINADGEIRTTYDYQMSKDINPRQWGMSFVLASELQQLSWKRKGLWSVYPENHIGRNTGVTEAFNETTKCGLAGPKQQPKLLWKDDQTKYGTNDFRSTKRNIIEASLFNENGGVVVNSCGLQHVRCWYDKGAVMLMIAEYDNPGAERFLRSHAKPYDRSLKKGDRIAGEIEMRLISE